MKKDSDNFLLSLGFPEIIVHEAIGHFDFVQSSRRILVIGPMGSGKTEYSARVWRDAQVTQKKSEVIANKTSTKGADRCHVFFIRSILDTMRFTDYPEDALAYRGGYERCGTNIAKITNSEDLEKIIKEHPQVGTWIIDEASFYDERIAYVVKQQSIERGLNFIFPALILNFRKEIFNHTAKLLLETSTEVIPLTAYCEHPECLKDSLYTYRYYTINGQECPALYFDPLIIIGGDKEKEDGSLPNYCTRCGQHHYLPGKEYTFLILKLLGEKAAAGNPQLLQNELYLLKNDIRNSELGRHLKNKYLAGDQKEPIYLNALQVPYIAEKALIFLFAEQNLITEELLKQYINVIQLDKIYISKTLAENKRPVNLDQLDLPF
ncbi:MAG: thymidine kinase [Spirochaetes bacterium]|nr:thymidine kinase [Spirochaetota bacterium]